MTADERLALVRLKIERAEKHICDLNSAIAAFMATKPYKVEVKRDAATRKPIYFVAEVKPVPQGITVILGDAIQALRTALDHLAYQLFLVPTAGSAGIGKHVYFPIAQDAAEYKKGSARRMMGLRQDAKDKIDALEPYGGGKGEDFWVLHGLNNIDKHRAMVAAGSSFVSVDILPMMMANMPTTLKEAFANSDHSLFLPAADNLCPLKVGDELLIGGADEQFNADTKFIFDVALNEPEILKPGPMPEMVRRLADLVSSTVTAFKPLLA